MKYMKMLAKLHTPGKQNTLKLTQKYADSAMRDTVIDNLVNVISVEFNKERKVHGPRAFEAMEDHRKFTKLKEKVAQADGDYLELSDDMLTWIKKHYTIEGFGAASSTTLVALQDLLDDLEKQDESAAMADFNEHKADKPLTVKEYYEGLGVKVEIVPEEDGKSQA